MTAPDPAGPGFTVSAVILFDEAGRVLTVRKDGTDAFMLPGGKLEAGESARDAAVREVAEELALDLEPLGLDAVGTFMTDTANEPDHWLRSYVFAHRTPVAGARPAGEIAELRWVAPDALGPDQAPLTLALADEIRARSSELGRRA